MAWERFHHICRRSVASPQADEPLAERVKAVEVDPDTALYGKPFRPGTLPRRLLDRLVAHPDQSRARYLLELYASFNLAAEAPQPLQLKRIAIYLAYVSVLFMAINVLYQVRVTPHFTAFFESFGVQTPYDVALFRDYGKAVAIGVLLLLGVALVMGHVLKGLADGSFGWGRAASFCCSR